MFATSLACLALAIYMEARGEPIKSQIAVAAVTLNRVKNKDYPSTVCEVVTQKGQFTWRVKGIKEKVAYKDSMKIADLYLQGKLENPIGSRLFFNISRLGKKYKTPYKPIRIKNMIFY